MRVDLTVNFLYGSIVTAASVHVSIGGAVVCAFGLDKCVWIEAIGAPD